MICKQDVDGSRLVRYLRVSSKSTQNFGPLMISPLLHVSLLSVVSFSLKLLLLHVTVHCDPWRIRPDPAGASHSTIPSDTVGLSQLSPSPPGGGGEGEGVGLGLGEAESKRFKQHICYFGKITSVYDVKQCHWVFAHDRQTAGCVHKYHKFIKNCDNDYLFDIFCRQFVLLQRILNIPGC